MASSTTAAAAEDVAQAQQLVLDLQVLFYSLRTVASASRREQPRPDAEAANDAQAAATTSHLEQRVAELTDQLAEAREEKTRLQDKCDTLTCMLRSSFGQLVDDYLLATEQLHARTRQLESLMAAGLATAPQTGCGGAPQGSTVAVAAGRDVPAAETGETLAQPPIAAQTEGPSAVGAAEHACHPQGSSSGASATAALGLRVDVTRGTSSSGHTASSHASQGQTHAVPAATAMGACPTASPRCESPPGQFCVTSTASTPPPSNYPPSAASGCSPFSAVWQRTPHVHGDAPVTLLFGEHEPSALAGVAEEPRIADMNAAGAGPSAAGVALRLNSDTARAIAERQAAASRHAAEAAGAVDGGRPAAGGGVQEVRVASREGGQAQGAASTTDAGDALLPHAPISAAKRLSRSASSPPERRRPQLLAAEDPSWPFEQAAQAASICPGRIPRPVPPAHPPSAAAATPGAQRLRSASSRSLRPAGSAPLAEAAPLAQLLQQPAASAATALEPPLPKHDADPGIVPVGRQQPPWVPAAEPAAATSRAPAAAHDAGVGDRASRGGRFPPGGSPYSCAATVMGGQQTTAPAAGSCFSTPTPVAHGSADRVSGSASGGRSCSSLESLASLVRGLRQQLAELQQVADAANVEDTEEEGEEEDDGDDWHSEGATSGPEDGVYSSAADSCDISEPEHAQPEEEAVGPHAAARAYAAATFLAGAGVDSRVRGSSDHNSGVRGPAMAEPGTRLRAPYNADAALHAAGRWSDGVSGPGSSCGGSSRGDAAGQEPWARPSLAAAAAQHMHHAQHAWDGRAPTGATSAAADTTGAAAHGRGAASRKPVAPGSHAAGVHDRAAAQDQTGSSKVQHADAATAAGTAAKPACGWGTRDAARAGGADVRPDTDAGGRALRSDEMFARIKAQLDALQSSFAHSSLTGAAPGVSPRLVRSGAGPPPGGPTAAAAEAAGGLERETGGRGPHERSGGLGQGGVRARRRVFGGEVAAQAGGVPAGMGHHEFGRAGKGLGGQPVRAGRGEAGLRGAVAADGR